ncbi:MAG TPA: ATP-binding cassette domain-containing protein [Spirochaetes bacterium]|nr:ATP-binding cassette domain-containing protein [Spirochaetota bacterium]
MIEFINVHKAFGQKVILEGIDLTIQKGEIFVIIGQSGIGKTVTLRHIAGLLEPDKGEVIIDGITMSYAPQAVKNRLRKRIGFLFQSNALLNWLTVYENVALPLVEHRMYPMDEIKTIVEEKLSVLQLLDAKDKSIADLSGGMKKRAALARLIVTNPDIILWDEPTTGLDPVMSMMISELIRQMQREFAITSLVVTHDMKSALYVGDRIGMLYNGKMVQVGTAEEISATENPIVRQFIEGSLTGPIQA